MTQNCQTCGVRPAVVHDVALRGGRWVASEVCEDCARRRRSGALPLAGAAFTALLLTVAAGLAIERFGREDRSPAPGPIDWTKRLRGGATPTLSAFSRDLTLAAREGKLDPVIGRDAEV